MPHFQSLVPRLAVPELAPVIAWYTGHLGFSEDMVWPADNPTFAILVRDDVSLQFHVPEDISPNMFGHAMLTIEVRDVQALHRQLVDAVPIAWGPEVYWYGRREFAVVDPNGYMLIFTEPTTDQPTDLE